MGRRRSRRGEGVACQDELLFQHAAAARRGVVVAVAVAAAVALAVVSPLADRPAGAAGSLVLAPGSGPVSTTVVATAIGLECQGLTATWDDPPTAFTPKGANQATASVPKGSKPGSHDVTAVCRPAVVDAFSNVTLTQSFEVTVTEATTTSTSPATTTKPTTKPTTPPTIKPTTAPTSADTTVPGSGEGGISLGLVVAGVLLLVGVAALAAYARYRRPRIHAGPARGLSQLADTLLGTVPTPPLSQIGPAAARVAVAFGSEPVAASTLATLLWEAFVDDEGFTDALRQAGASDRARREGQTIVVRHAGGCRHDLMVFDPGYSGEPSGRTLSIGILRPPLRRPPPSMMALLRRGAGPWARLDAGTVMGALGEIVAAGQLGLVVAPSPYVVPTRSPSPPWGVWVSGQNEPVATVGAIVVTSDGSRAVTTALHAVTKAASVSVNGRPAHVTSTHEPTDSCVIALTDQVADHRGRGRAGPLHGASPSEEQVTFEGLTSGLKTTFVQGWTTNIHSEQNFLAAMVFTDPDTSSGDSGAALVDSRDRILGFAAYRSGNREPKQHSAWVWADQVLRVHGVRTAGD